MFGCALSFPITRSATHLSGLLCDGAAGSIHYSVTDSVKQPDGQWRITTNDLHHNFTKVEFTPLGDQVVPDSPDVPALYGDIVQCIHPSLT